MDHLGEGDLPVRFCLRETLESLLMEGIPWETKSTINQVRLEPTIILSLVTVIHFINTDPSSAGLFKGFDRGFFRQKTNMEPENYHIIPQLAVYTTNIPLIYCLLGDYIYISPTTY